MKLVTSALLFFFGAMASANAASLYFDFTGGYDFGRELTFYDEGGSDFSVTASTFVFDGSGRTFASNDFVTQNSLGLGVRSQFFDSNQLDGRRVNEGLLFDINGGTPFDILSVSFSLVDSNDDVSIFVDVAGDDDGLFFGDVVDLSDNGGTLDFGGLLPDLVAIGFGAFQNNDSFRIADLSVVVAPVPLPAAAPLFGAALLGGALYRRRKMKAAL